MNTEVTNTELFCAERGEISGRNVQELENEYFRFTDGRTIEVLDKVIYFIEGKLVMYIFFR
jgi:hypothetical protein